MKKILIEILIPKFTFQINSSEDQNLDCNHSAMLRDVEEVVPKAPSQAAASPLAGRGVVEEVGGRGAGPVDSRAAAAAGHAASAVPVSPVIEEPEPTSPAGPPESSEAILAPRYRSATVEGCSAKSAPPVPRAFTVAASEGEGSSRVSEGTRFLSMIFLIFQISYFNFFGTV